MKLLFEEAFAPETWANWALFFAAVLAAIIALRTLYAIHKEAVEIRKVADAANENAQALINAERAWIMADIAWAADVPHAPRPTTLRVCSSRSVVSGIEKKGLIFPFV